MNRQGNGLAVIVAAFGMAAVATSSSAQAYTLSFFNPALPGTTASDKWSNFDNWSKDQYGGNFPGSGVWATPGMVAPTSTQAAGQEAVFRKTSGDGYPISFGGPTDHNFIYVPNPGAGPGAFRVFDDTPVANLKTVVFQLASGPGAVNTEDILSVPVLNYNGGTQHVAATATSGGTRYSEQGPDFLNPSLIGEAYRERYWQFDLTSVAAPITSFEVVWSEADTHSQVYSLQLDQGNTFVSVPEPASLGLLGSAGALLGVRRRRSK